jgi:hypothetical protein
LLFLVGTPTIFAAIFWQLPQKPFFHYLITQFSLLIDQSKKSAHPYLLAAPPNPYISVLSPTASFHFALKAQSKGISTHSAPL